MNEMTPPTPAAVRFLMNGTCRDCTEEESKAFVADPRFSEEMLCDHIRAVASQLRSEAIGSEDSDLEATAVVDMLRRFANKLEGREP